MQPLKEQEKTQLWLSQFDHRPGDRELAERLLDSINYCPLNEFKTSLTTLIKRSLPLKEPRHSSLSVSYKNQGRVLRDSTRKRKPIALGRRKSMCGRTAQRRKPFSP